MRKLEYANEIKDQAEVKIHEFETLEWAIGEGIKNINLFTCTTMYIHQNEFEKDEIWGFEIVWSTVPGGCF